MKIISSKEGLDGSLKIHWNDIQGAKSPWTKMNSIPVSICLKVFLNGEGINSKMQKFEEKSSQT